MEAALELEKTVNQSLLDLHICADPRGSRARKKPSTRASWICTNVLTPRVTHICVTSLRLNISVSRWMESSPSETGSSRSSALETVLASTLLTRRSDHKSPFVFLHPIGKLINSRQNYLLSFKIFISTFL